MGVQVGVCVVDGGGVVGVGVGVFSTKVVGVGVFVDFFVGVAVPVPNGVRVLNCVRGRASADCATSEPPSSSKITHSTDFNPYNRFMNTPYFKVSWLQE